MNVEERDQEVWGAVVRLEAELKELRIETRKGFDDLNKAILGDLAEGRGGLMSEVNRNTVKIDGHEKRLKRAEDGLAVATKWINDREAQWRLLMLVGGGNLVGLLYVIYLIINHAGEIP
jgi:hypothetical protein